MFLQQPVEKVVFHTTLRGTCSTSVQLFFSDSKFNLFRKWQWSNEESEKVFRIFSLTLRQVRQPRTASLMSKVPPVWKTNCIVWGHADKTNAANHEMGGEAAHRDADLYHLAAQWSKSKPLANLHLLDYAYQHIADGAEWWINKIKCSSPFALAGFHAALITHWYGNINRIVWLVHLSVSWGKVYRTRLS